MSELKHKYFHDILPSDIAADLPLAISRPEHPSPSKPKLADKLKESNAREGKLAGNVSSMHELIASQARAQSQLSHELISRINAEIFSDVITLLDEFKVLASGSERAEKIFEELSVLLLSLKL